VLDGWEQFVAAADEHDAGRTVDTLLGLLRAGASAGLTVAIAGDRGTLAPRLGSAIGTKLVLRLTDRADYALAGLAERAVPMRLPPGRAVRAGDGTQVQLAHLGADPSVVERDRAIARVLARWPDRPDAGALIRVRELPDCVALSQLPRRRDRITLGVGGDDAAPIDIDLFAGAGRLLVAGPPRSGRSSVLIGILGQVLAERRRVLIAAAPHSPLTRAATARGVAVLAPDAPTFEPPRAAGPTVLLVDDADRFQDTPVGEAVTTWLRSASPQLAVVAAACTDEAALAFRGILAEVRRARCVLLLRPGPGDGDLAGIRLPRPGRQPPGRGLLIGEPAWGERFADGPVPIQLAQP
jgi:S-DNA-T family DNA segregation ATPase FtsK/SpoIIIE